MEDYKNSPLSDGTNLCLECGLCCTGVFHANAAIYTPEDKACAKSFNASIFLHEGQEFFKLPCPIYEGKCPIYPNNPSVCTTHKCNLLESVENCEIKLEKGINIVQEMKELIYSIEHDIQFASFGTNTKQISSLFNQFFNSTSKEERKKFSSLLKKYGAFSYLKKKHFYE